MASTSASTCGGTERAVEGDADVEAALVIHHQRRKALGGIGRDGLGAAGVGWTRPVERLERDGHARRGRKRHAPPDGRTVTQNCPPAEPSSVLSGSVQTETSYGPAVRLETIGNGGPVCADAGPCARERSERSPHDHANNWPTVD